MSKSRRARAVLLHWAHLSVFTQAATEVSEAERLTHTLAHTHMRAIVTLAIKSKGGPIMIPFRGRIALPGWMMAHHIICVRVCVCGAEGGIGASGEIEGKVALTKRDGKEVWGMREEQVMNDDGAYVSWLTNQGGLKEKVPSECVWVFFHFKERGAGRAEETHRRVIVTNLAWIIYSTSSAFFCPPFFFFFSKNVESLLTCEIFWNHDNWKQTCVHFWFTFTTDRLLSCFCPPPSFCFCGLDIRHNSLLIKKIVVGAQFINQRFRHNSLLFRSL